MDIGAFLDGSGRRSSGGAGGPDAGGFDRAANAADAMAAAMRNLNALLGGAGAARVAARTAPNYSAGAFAAATAGSDPRAMFAQIAGAGRDAGAAAARSLAAIPAELAKIPLVARSAASAVTDLAAKLFVLDRVAGVVKSALVDPFVDAARAVFDATEASRKFEYSLSGTLGSLEKARDLNQQIVRASRDFPGTLDSLREAALALAHLPGLSGRLTLADDVSAATAQVEKYASLLQKLATLDPAQGERGAGTALRNLAEGGDGAVVSLKRRFGISDRSLARLVARDVSPDDGDTNKALAAVRSDPSVALTAVQRYVDTFIPPDAAQQMGRLLGTRVEKLREVLRAGLAKVGDSGVYDGVVAKLESLGDTLFKHMDSPRFKEQARAISDGMARTLDAVGRAVVAFLAKVTGTTGGADTVAGVVDLFAGAVGRLGDLSQGLPALAARAGDFVKGLGDVVAQGVEKVERLIAAIEGFSVVQNLVPGERLSAWKDGGLSDGERRARLAVEVGRTYGIEGATVNKTFLGPKELGGDESAQELFGGDALNFASHAVYRRLTGDGSWKEAADHARDYVKGAAYDVDPAGVADPAQRATMARLWVALQKLSPRDLEPDRANPAALSALRSEPGLLDTLRSIGRAAGAGASPGGAATGAATRPAAAAGPAYGELVPKLFALDRHEYQGPNFQPLIQSVGQVLARLEAQAPKSALDRTLTQARGVFSADLAGNPNHPVRLDDAFGRLAKTYQAAAGQLDAAINEGTAALDGQARPDPQVARMVDTMRSRKADLTPAYEEARRALADHLIGGAADFGRLLAASLGELPPETGAVLAERVRAGTTSLGDKVAATLAAAGLAVADRSKAWGADALPLADRLRQGGEDADRRVRAIRDAGRLGDLPDRFGGMRFDLTSDQVEHLPAVPTVGVERRTADYLRLKAIPDQRALFDQARTAYQANPTDERAIANLGVAQHELAELSTKFREAHEASDRFFGSMVEWANKVQESLENSIGKGIESLITGTGNLSDVFKSFARDVISSFSQMASKNLLRSIVGDPEGSKSGFGGIMGSLISGLTGALGGGTGAKAAGDGDVWPSFTPIAAFGDGGVATGPRVGIVGERNQPEGIVPLQGGMIPLGLDSRGGVHAQLPGNRRIPAAFTSGAAMFAEGGVFGGWGGSAPYGGGGGGGQPAPVQIYNVANMEEARQAGYRGMHNQILNSILHQARPGGALRKRLDQKV